MQPLPDLSVSDRLVVNQTGFALWVASFRQTLHTTPAGWFVAAWMAWGRVPDKNLLLWLVLFFVVWMMGLLSIDRALKDGCDQQTHGPRLRVMAALDGIAWGLLGWLLAGHDVLLDAIMVALLCGGAVFMLPQAALHTEAALLFLIVSTVVTVGALSYAVVPFNIDRSARTLAISLNAPEEVRPGKPFTLGYSTDKPADLLLYGVDEGILQVAGYQLPDPLAHYLQKKALQVRSLQMLDLILPEFTALQRQLAGVGGDNERMAMAAARMMMDKNLNPFARRAEQPGVGPGRNRTGRSAGCGGGTRPRPRDRHQRRPARPGRVGLRAPPRATRRGGGDRDG